MTLTTVLDIFRDGDWHYLPTVAQKLKLDDTKAERVFSFLAEYKFIEIGKSGSNARIDPRVKKFLDEIDKLG